ncbi:GtrA family protein [Paenibacillus sp. N1-5-1-14]|uniref:GtrA family protein n=1 Tax=Paenibacillus radicibacter TaxID=2972488 RepID=UPI002158F405|nr:GtrA family protein [Paenibacillus radicibacter]MCR8645617.1 GtrA family protein [Paenibacillus radicibacter]
MNTLRKLFSSSFIRFLLVGVLNTLVGLSVSFIVLNLAGWNYWLATATGNIVGAVCSYFLNRTFTFRSNATVGSSWWKFSLVIGVCFGLSYGMSLWLTQGLELIWPNISTSLFENAAILLGNGIYTILNYLGHRYFTFRVPQAKTSVN